MKENNMKIINQRALGLLGTMLLTAMVGCVENTQSYESTELYPTSIDLVDIRSKEVIWTMDVPVRHKLELEFWHERGIATKWQPPTKVVYRLYPMGSYRKMTYESSIPLNIPVLVKVRHRPAPEYAMPPVVTDQAVESIADPAIEPAVTEPAPVEPAVTEPAAVEPAAAEPEEPKTQVAEPQAETAKPESDAKQEESTQVVEPAPQQPAPAEVEPAAAEPAAEPAVEPAAEEIKATPQAEKGDDKWELPSLDPEKPQDKDNDYPQLKD